MAQRAKGKLEISDEDEALLEKIVKGISRYHMEVPSIFMLEALSPLAVVGSYAMQFLGPVVTTFISPLEYDRLAQLLQRREVIENVIVRLERAVNRA